MGEEMSYDTLQQYEEWKKNSNLMRVYLRDSGAAYDLVDQAAWAAYQSRDAELAAMKESIESGQRVLREDADTNAARAEKAETELATKDLRILRFESAWQLIAAPMRPDGTWNRDREACRQLAEEELKHGD